MSSIYNFLRIVWNEIVENNNDDKSLLFLALLCSTIPFSLAINNVFLVLFILTSLVYSLKHKFILEFAFVLPILLYTLMCLSYFWSIDKKLTIIAIPKEISLFLIPFTFMLRKRNSLNQLNYVLKFFSWSIIIISIFFLLRAVVRFFITSDLNVFFYHGDNVNDFGLVPKLLNAIHVSVFVSWSYFFILNKKTKSKKDFFGLIILLIFNVLLSSKNILIVFTLLNIIYFFYFSEKSPKQKVRNVIIIILLVIISLSVGKIGKRFFLEFEVNKEIKQEKDNNLKSTNDINYISIHEAWYNEKFTSNDFFSGTSFRVYQFRLFTEFLEEDDIFLKGFGLNASYKKIEEKGVMYNVFLGDDINEGYQKKNFHNQYIQVFSELGLIGLLILVLMLIYLIKTSIQLKDFSQFTFAILMISLFLTESFLWRQRGIVFFSVFYSIFCLKNSIRKNL